MLMYSTAALLFGFVLDLVFGDPRGFPHIVVGMGKMIAVLEEKLRRVFPKTEKGERLAGVSLVVITLLVSTLLPLFLLMAAYRLSPWLGMVIESFLIYQCLAVRSLRDESMKVHASLVGGNLEQARRDVSMIVGRDTEQLDTAGITKATVETIAENTNDGVIAPMFYIMLGGATFGLFYKAVNTMDSMVGYRNERYLHFGRCAAKLDDVMNFIPARLAAQLMILASKICGMNSEGAKEIYKRDSHNHVSPNAACTEAVCSGALGIQLGGDAYYFGKLYEKPTIGDHIRAVKTDDITRANRLMYTTALLMLFLSLILRGLVLGGIIHATL